MDIRIIYEDNHLLVVEKPVNMPVQEDSSGDRDLLTAFKQYIKEKYNKPGEVYLGLVHRLDRPAGGVMVFARTSKAAGRLSSQFSSSSAKKRYCAVVSGMPPECGAIKCNIAKDEASFSSYVCAESDPKGKPASLEYEVIARGAENSLVDIALYTGRHHQIRVQFLHIGHPLVGDQRYNKAAEKGVQLALWAYSLTIKHPTTDEEMRFVSLPQGGAFEAYEQYLKPLLNGIYLIYADSNIVVLNKRAHETVAQKDGGESALEERASLVFGELYPVHRLDANTTGLILFARNIAAKNELDKAFKNNTVKKIYRCIVKGSVNTAATATAYMQKDSERAVITVHESYAPQRKEMVTSYKPISCHDGITVLEIELHTGRTHQIRAHMAYLGHPVVGDDKYGDRALNKRLRCKYPQLCATEIWFILHNGGILDYLSDMRFRIEPRFSFGTEKL